jgi:hypothetical protein
MAREKLKAALLAVADDTGFDEEVGSLELPPYKRAGVFRDAFDVADLIDDEEVTDEELSFLRDQVGVVLVIRSEERLTLKCFVNEDELEDYWEDLSADLGADAEDPDETVEDDVFAE